MAEPPRRPGKGLMIAPGRPLAQVAARQLAIAAELRDEAGREGFKAFLGRHPEFLAAGLSAQYPLDGELLGRYADRWDWHRLSRNLILPWSLELIERYADRWSWGEISWNRALPWSRKLIEHYANQWDWEQLAENPALPWSAALLVQFEGRWHYRALTDLPLPLWSLVRPADVMALMDALPSQRPLTFAEGWDAYQRGDYAVAVAAWQPLAEQGDTDAQFNLGVSYQHGIGVIQDDAQAMYWYQQAAAQGHALAPSNLEEMSRIDPGWERDMVPAYNQEALRWLEQANYPPGEAPALLALARWGLENLELEGPWARERMEMEGLLCNLELWAKVSPEEAVRYLVCGVEPDPMVWPEDLGPDLEGAAARLVDRLSGLLEAQKILMPRD